MPSYEDLSNDISLALYSMGYDNSTTRKPVVIKDDDNSTRLYLVGSSAEGVADSEDSDFDFLRVIGSVYCSDNPTTTGLLNEKTMEIAFGFKTVSENTAPGYTMLRIQSPEHVQEYASALPESCHFKDINGQTFLTHNLQDFAQNTLHKLSIHGPAITANLYQTINEKLGSKEIDLAVAIPFFSRYLHRWTEHKFPHGWPSSELLQEIRQMHGHVAAVGNKSSKYCDMEWRICYTDVEIKLVHSLNNTQLYVYILLKRIAKHILKPVCRESCVTSYMIKNLILWMAALLPTRHFQKSNLILMLNVSLKILYNHVKKNYLPNFMIPDRNLISERLTEEDRLNVIKALEEVLQNGPCSIFQHRGFRDLNNVMEKATVSPKSFETEKESKAFMQEIIAKIFNGDINSIDDEKEKFYKHYLHLCCGISIDELNKMSDKEIEDVMEGFDVETVVHSMLKNVNTCRIM